MWKARAFFLISITVLIFRVVPIIAGEAVDELKPVDLDGDGKMENVSLPYSEPDDYGNCTATLEVRSLGKIYSVQLKEGLNADTTYLRKLVISPRIKPFIMIDARRGSNIDRRIYSFNGHQIKEELLIFSNFPSFVEKDTDRDGVNEIVAKYRDDRPGRDPKKDSYERIYKWNGTKFYDCTEDRFKKAEAPPPPKPSEDDEL